MFKHILYSIPMSHGKHISGPTVFEFLTGDYKIQTWIWKLFHNRLLCLLNSDFLYFATEQYKTIYLAPHTVPGTPSVLNKYFW